MKAIPEAKRDRLIRNLVKVKKAAMDLEEIATTDKEGELFQSLFEAAKVGVTVVRGAAVAAPSNRGRKPGKK